MVDIKTLESWLWEAACSIRGQLDAPKYKDYILPLIFVKRLSDVYDDEINKLTKEYGNKELAEDLVAKDHSLVRFYIAPECSWSVIRTHIEKGLGEKLTTVVRQIAKDNPRLDGVIDIIDFNATAGGQRNISDGKLSKLIEIISKYRLGLDDAEPDILGRAYEYLLRKFAEGQGQSAGEFYTPKEVGWLMAYILDPKEGQSVYDPACGSGGLLIKCQLALREKQKKVNQPLQLYGQEFNPVTFAIAKMNMIIHDMEGKIAIGDTLLNPKFLQGANLKSFDLVTANPMWNQDGYGESFYEEDKFNRFPFGFLNQNSADWGWSQHMLASLKSDGKASVVLDTGAVSRGSGNKNKDKERDVRKAVVEKDWIEAVILLPDNLFYNTTAPGIIIVFNKNKAKDRQNKIILINASDEKKKSKESSKNYLPEKSVQKIVETYQKFEDQDKFAKVVGIEEIRKSDYNLSPSRYVQNGEDEIIREIDEIWSEIQLVEAEEKEVDVEIKKIMKKIQT